MSQMASGSAEQPLASVTTVFKCKVCRKVLKNEKTLKGHSRVHSKERPFKCQECQTTFKYSTSLKSHRSIHTGAKPFVCPFITCSKAFRVGSGLQYHLNVHKEEYKNLFAFEDESQEGEQQERRKSKRNSYIPLKITQLLKKRKFDEKEREGEGEEGEEDNRQEEHPPKRLRTEDNPNSGVEEYSF